ncbi:YceI family protein [Thalassotalea agarivorans]|uniref:Polyisoprenoid-binding protein YceI n=1 Tax=Thalassotalea agarivorans TaxID=349064 RepID=A0A1I0AEY2_THASX|nr:YceI family protein [Thalassotalea agarivorans]SES92735.1 Polyisoprenoid-binding protein YceI [Thalassotalea agarivorans]
MTRKLLAAALFTAMTPLAFAADYTIDDKGAHASINFKVKHLGYSWLTGRFNTFSGDFNYDANNVAASKINVNIDPASVDSNHAERDKHLKGKDFLDVSSFDSASFVSKKVEDLGNGKLKITGDFTLKGITKEVVIDANKIGEGQDPWGGYRVGFEGTTQIAMADYNMMDLGPASAQIELELHVEGIKK